MISLLVIFLLLFQNLPLESGNEYLVQNFTVEDGLPVNSVNGIVQDDEGYLWFSSLDGLVRYDGYNFRVYNSGNTSGLFTNRIGGMLKTASNEIWLIHPNGTITQKTGNRFKTYSEANGDFTGVTNRMLEAPNGDIRISTSEGIFLFNSETESFYSPDEPLLKSDTWALESHVGGGIFGLNKNGLVHWNGNDSSVLVKNEDFPIPPQSVLHIKHATVNDVWIMGGGGLFKYSLYNNEIDFIFRTEDTSSTVWNFNPQPDGTYIINTSEGFYSWEPVTNSVTKTGPEISTTTDRINLVFRGSENESIFLGDDEVLINGQTVFETEEIQSGFIDKEGSLWISTLREGVFQIRRSDFTNITSEQIPGFENIYPIIQSSGGAMWAGSFTTGIYMIEDTKITNWNTSNSNLTGNLCRFLFEDSDGTIYASMWGDGLWRFNDGAQDWQRVREIDALTGENITVETMHRDSGGNLYIGSNFPLIITDGNDFTILTDSEDSRFLKSRVIRENRNGVVFIGTNGNGFTILHKDGTSANYTTKNSPITSDFIRDIYVQSPDTLWLATENLGLNRVILDGDGNLASVVHITENDGLLKNSLHKIIETPGNQLWISSNGGIMRISKDGLNNYADGTISELTVLGFDEKNGMASREANGGVQTAGLLTANQKLWFPNQKGITIIDPLQLSANHFRQQPQPLIEEIVLPDTTLSTSNQSTIKIPRGERNVRIKFSAPNFSSPEHIQFRYKLEGLNPDWENGNQSREAVLTNIPPGSHKFQLITTQAGGIAEPAQASIFITIPPYFYETGWFILCMVLLGGFFIFIGIKYRTRLLEDREKKLQQRVDDQTKKLKKAAEQKSRFFSGITHELKTPLSLISGPLEDLLENPKNISSETAQSRLRMMNRNNHRLQNLVDQILDVTKLNSDALKLTFKPVNIVDYTKQIVGQFQSKLEQQNIQSHFESDSLTEKIYLDTNAWERIMINLLSNAIRFSPRGSSIYVRITDLENRVRISVKDEGIGIDEKDVDKVFDYLYQAEGAYSAEGTGIGLYLVKGLVDQMEGEIDLISQKDEGAEFITTLKKGFDHLRDSNRILHEPFIITPQKPMNTVDPALFVEKFDQEAGSSHLLIVEDNDDFREYLDSILSEKYQVSTAAEGTQALEILDDSTPDLIISDVMMPGMNGLEFVENLRKREELKHLPVLFLSAKDHELDVEKGLSGGADIYLTKPIKSTFLLSQIAAVLRREQVLKSNKIEEEKPGENPLVRQVRTIVFRQLANPSLNIDLLADTLFMSRRKLYSDWKKCDEVSLNDFIKQIRLEEAKILLKEKGFSVQEAASAVGYSDANYFSTSFKKEFEMNPSEVMK